MKPEAVSVWIDGARVERDGAKVSVFDRGFLYGDSVFETMRTYRGRVFALDEHLARLAESASRVLIALPVALEVLAAEVTRAVEQTAHAESYVRLMITRGTGALGLDPAQAARPLRVLLVAALEPLPAHKYERGIAVVSFVTSRQADATAAAGAKIGNYLVAVLAADAARKQGADESLIVDAQGRVSEGATSNVFWVSGGQLGTPPVEAGILAGITRQHILACADREGLDVQFRLPALSELCSADEVFVSSSIRELVPVVTIDGLPVGAGVPGPVSQRLLAAFRAHVGGVP